MATKVNPTPTLTGANAERFIQKLNTPSTEEEIEALKRADRTFKTIKFILKMQEHPDLCKVGDELHNGEVCV